MTTPRPAVSCALDDLPKPGGFARVGEGEHAVAVFNIDGEYYAVHDLCTHDKSSLADDGWFEGTVVECGWHMAKFDVRSGKVLSLPAVVPLAVYDVVIEGDEVRFVPRPEEAQ